MASKLQSRSDVGHLFKAFLDGDLEGLDPGLWWWDTVGWV
jgi:hypothetical protein